MELKSIKLRERKYIPKVWDNKNLPDDEQFIVFFKNLPGTSELSNYISSGGNIDFRKFVIENIGKINNLKINGETIETAKALAEANHYDLVDLFVELFNYAFPGAENFAEGES